MSLGVHVAYIGMYEFQWCLPSHRGSWLERGYVLFSNQKHFTLIKVHILPLRNEVIYDNLLYPFVTHVAQPHLLPPSTMDHASHTMC